MRHASVRSSWLSGMRLKTFNILTDKYDALLTHDGGRHFNVRSKKWESISGTKKEIVPGLPMRLCNWFWSSWCRLSSCCWRHLSKTEQSRLCVHILNLAVASSYGLSLSSSPRLSFNTVFQLNLAQLSFLPPLVAEENFLLMKVLGPVFPQQINLPLI